MWAYPIQIQSFLLKTGSDKEPRSLQIDALILMERNEVLVRQLIAYLSFLCHISLSFRTMSSVCSDISVAHANNYLADIVTG